LAFHLQQLLQKQHEHGVDLGVHPDQSLMGSQSTAKTIFLLSSMVGWMLLGAALIYLFPAIADLILHSERTHTWLTTLRRSNYSPSLALMVGSMLLVLEIVANWIWYSRYDGKL
jgi:hypothetical protein